VQHQDDQADPKKAISAFRNLIDAEGVRLIIGPNWSSLGLPLIDLASRQKVLMISPSLGMAKFNESSEFLFNTWPHDYILSQKLAEYVIGKGHHRIALVGAENVWVKEQTSAFKARFEQLGGSIAYLTEPLPDSNDLRTEALRIKNTPKLDALVSTTDGVIVGSLVAKALNEINVHLPMYSITLDQAAIDAAQGSFEGLEFLTFLTPQNSFKKRYEERFKTQIDIGADSAYDAVMLLAQAIRESSSIDPKILAQHMAKVKEYSGASGQLVSDGKRGFSKDYAVKRVTGGKPEDLKPNF
jgi:branched-chain amino acid transport system substrate-binding protein